MSVARRGAAARRARTTRASALQYQREVMLRCPRCGGLAWGRVIDPADPDLFATRRLTCTVCVHRATWTSGVIMRNRAEARDDYFRLPLYLQVRCRQGVLWAYNPAHLDELEAWLGAGLRARRADANFGWSNQSFWSRLPRWIKQAKHREELVRALRRLHALLAR